jgi:hypothetical protein
VYFHCILFRPYPCGSLFPWFVYILKNLLSFLSNLATCYKQSENTHLSMVHIPTSCWIDRTQSYCSVLIFFCAFNNQIGMAITLGLPIVKYDEMTGLISTKCYPQPQQKLGMRGSSRSDQLFFRTLIIYQ